jgi:hypothetical protein
MAKMAILDIFGPAPRGFWTDFTKYARCKPMYRYTKIAKNGHFGHFPGITKMIIFVKNLNILLKGPPKLQKPSFWAFLGYS